MTCQDIVISVAIGIGTGFISGLLSGLIVTKYYRTKDEKREKSLQFEKDVRLLAEYIIQVIYELNSARRTKSYEDLGRVISKKPRYEDIRNNKQQSQKFIEAFNDIEVISIDLNNSVITGEIKELDLHKIGSRLLTQMYNVVQYKKVN